MNDKSQVKSEFELQFEETQRLHEQSAALRYERDKLLVDNTTLQSQLTQLRSELDNKSRELVAHRERTRGNYWAWQGNNDDHLESLSSRCPVLISAKQLLEITTQRDEAVAACAAMRGVIELAWESRGDEEQWPVELVGKLAESRCNTDCGKAFLERMKEARWLISNVHGMRSETTREWFERATAWLTPTDAQKGESCENL